MAPSGGITVGGSVSGSPIIAGGNVTIGTTPVDPEQAKKFSAMIPMARIGEPDEIKGLALLLASPASSFITGTVVPIDGGTTAK